MRWKFITMSAALVLVVILAAPRIGEVKAQGLVEYALILVVIPVGSDQEAEILWSHKKLPTTLCPTPSGVCPVIYRIIANDPANPSCVQTVHASVVAIDGLNSLRLRRDNDTLVINGGEVKVPLDTCFDDRIAFEVGEPFPARMVDRIGSDPNAVAAVQKKEIHGVFFLDEAGRTVAIGRNLHTAYLTPLW